MTSSRLEITVPVDTPVIEFRRVVAASPALVFDLWTNPDHLRRWWGPEDYELMSIDIDLRVGGTYRYVHRAPNGVEYAFHGAYLELDPPGRLVYTTVHEGEPDSEAVDSFTFHEADVGTLINCWSQYPSLAIRDKYVAEGMVRGLTESHERLDALIARLSEPPEGSS
ncbi:MAG: hypothetical protein QOC66_1123 [Pseudonocardiales bacterium]|nr:hypothetical protein [Pseudonocardiales bacterium]